MRIGAKLPNSGPLPAEIGIPQMARDLEEAGYDSLWVSDHIVQPAVITSPYPFVADGRATWASDLPYVDALIALALAAAVTSRVRLGTAVLVVPLRNPVALAKQAASIDVASGGRLELGIGAGWLAEEFEALNVPFHRRGSRMVEYVAILRECWQGETAERASEWYTLPAGTQCWPRPAHRVPLLVGGHSSIALGRAGRIGDGWLAQQSALALDPEGLAAEVAEVSAAAARSYPADVGPRVVLRIVDSLAHPELVASRMEELERAGVCEVIVDVPVDRARAEESLATLRGEK